MEKYSLEFLSEEFRKHEIEYMASDRYEKDGFNLPRAFKLIVDEMIHLKMMMDDISLRHIENACEKEDK